MVDGKYQEIKAKETLSVEINSEAGVSSGAEIPKKALYSLFGGLTSGSGYVQPQMQQAQSSYYSSFGSAPPPPPGAMPSSHLFGSV
jgi:hypothetical protein